MGLVLFFIIDVYLLLYMGQTLELPIQNLNVRMQIMLALTLITIIYGVNEMFRKTSLVNLRAFVIYLILVLFEILIHGTNTASHLLYELYFPIMFFSSFLVLNKANSKISAQIVSLQNIFCIVFFLVFIYGVFFMFRVEGIYKSTCFYLCCFLPFILASSKSWMRILGIFLCILPSIIVSKRTPFFGVIAACIVYFFISIKQDKHKWRIIFSALSAIGVVYFFSLNLQTDIFDRIRVMNEDGGSGRLDIFSTVWQGISDSSWEQWFWGHGVYQEYATDNRLAAHNDFLEIFWDYGFIGLFVYTFMLFSLFKNRFFIKRYKPKLYGVYLASIVQFFVCSLSTNLLFNPSYIALFAIFWGYCYAGIRNRVR